MLQARSVKSRIIRVLRNPSDNQKALFRRQVVLLLVISLLLVSMFGATRALQYNNASARSSCGIVFMGVRGSGETKEAGRMAGDIGTRFAQRLAPVPVERTHVDYVASSVDDMISYKSLLAYNSGGIGNQLHYNFSAGQGKAQLLNALYLLDAQCKDYSYQLVLAGYSQGADVVASVLQELNPRIEREASIRKHLAGAALIADARRNPQDWSVIASPEATNGGVMGKRAPLPQHLAGRVRSWCRPTDPVCDFNISNFSACANRINPLAKNSKEQCNKAIKAVFDQHGRYIEDGKTEAAAVFLANRIRRGPQLPNYPPATPVAPIVNPTPGPAAAKPAPAPRQAPVPTPSPRPFPVPQPSPAPTPPPVPSPNRRTITSYDRMQSGAPHHGYFDYAWQNFVAQSNTITYLSATVGTQGAAAGTAVAGRSLTLRLCTNPNCTTILAQAHPQIINYGETAADIGDVAVTPGATYYVVWYQPAFVNGKSWVTYWWAGGTTVSTSDQLQATVRGYNR